MPTPLNDGLQRIEVSGFKCLTSRTGVDVRPLTILAGANSSGKSSIVQPLLLLKQTMDSPYDPGALLLDGPHVRFTSADQLLSQGAAIREFAVQVSISGRADEFCFKHDAVSGFELKTLLTVDSRGAREVYSRDAEILVVELPHFSQYVLRADRCRFKIDMAGEDQVVVVTKLPADLALDYLAGMLHIPGLRGTSDRTFKSATAGPRFAGPFDTYTASVLHNWSDKHPELLDAIGEDLAALNLTSRVSTRRIDDTSLEVLVDRAPVRSRARKSHLVSIADVGLGIGQVLPVLVGLRAATRPHVVYVEQPELHLHPKAQVALARQLAAAAARGVRVIVETHSALLLRGIQTLVATGSLDPSLVMLHWFERKAKDGSVAVRSAELDSAGAFGEWPVDFDDVSLAADREFINASFAHTKAS